MIPLVLPARAEATERFVVRLKEDVPSANEKDAVLVSSDGARRVFASQHGLFELQAPDDMGLDGDVIGFDPIKGQARRLIRSSSTYNTFLVTERCDQLCVMCSQPPKKSHVDRWAELTSAALLAPQGVTIGISGGEPTLYKEALLDMLESVLISRPDLHFHVLSNGQHFERSDIPRLRRDSLRRVSWGIPLYSHRPENHDAIVKKEGAHALLRAGLSILLESGAHVELRTVLLSSNLADLPSLARYVATHMGFLDQWSIMQLENIGFARNRFADLLVDTASAFPQIAEAIDIAELFGVRVSLFNCPRCAIPPAYRRYAVRSISDWKQKFSKECEGCAEQAQCSGFFEWHPDALMKVKQI